MPETKPTLESISPLKQEEIELIHYIRTRFRFGEIVVETRDGKPYRMKKAVEYQTLG